MYKKYFIYSRLKAELTNVICGLTAKKPGSAPCPTLVIEYGTTLLLLLLRLKTGQTVLQLAGQDWPGWNFQKWQQASQSGEA